MPSFLQSDPAQSYPPFIASAYHIFAGKEDYLHHMVARPILQSPSIALVYIYIIFAALSSSIFRYALHLRLEASGTAFREAQIVGLLIVILVTRT